MKILREINHFLRLRMYRYIARISERAALWWIGKGPFRLRQEPDQATIEWGERQIQYIEEAEWDENVERLLEETPLS
jgi:hypothetical protein